MMTKESNCKYYVHTTKGNRYLGCVKCDTLEEAREKATRGKLYGFKTHIVKSIRKGE